MGEAYEPEGPGDAGWRADAARMVREQLEARGIADPAVLDAMASVPRHRFLPGLALEQAYSDHAIPIDAGQTVSQPYIVARMTELLGVAPGTRVLEIGGGSGYQTAVLLALGAEVVSIERHAALADAARARLAAWFDAPRVRVVVGDGTLGWPDGAPYDRVLGAAAAPRAPEPWKRQLADPGRMVLPLGDRDQQTLAVLSLDARVWSVSLDTPCRFVPMLGEHGFPAGEDD